ncbi:MULTISPECIES: YqcC family protein [unclassified Shewanella]|uniref:YqcC family protein n=1 Tax=unclassified Shewanella TaxID=196818 RepID=UPI001BC1C513|nr:MULTISPECIES: YqcC family protein [unclassified Shewanella]GIU16713.1 hypothetical protein TUM4444_29740 [Shewanella sp. MBTL60-112-B1]GIU35834.1 hypothetical protein TUM4445_26150 [Shewanella sp. MBTL60-112-B2]
MITLIVREKLLALETELAKHSLLSTAVPTEQALASTAPFACDVMPFEQWLQFIFLPKMHYLIDNQIPLPTAISIAPMAEHVWAANIEYKRIIQLLTELDALLTQAP